MLRFSLPLPMVAIELSTPRGKVTRRSFKSHPSEQWIPRLYPTTMVVELLIPTKAILVQFGDLFFGLPRSLKMLPDNYLL